MDIFFVCLSDVLFLNVQFERDLWSCFHDLFPYCNYVTGLVGIRNKQTLQLWFLHSSSFCLVWWLHWLDPLSHECCVLGCQEQILFRPPELGFEGHTMGHICCLAWWSASPQGHWAEVFMSILLWWLFSLQRPVLRQKMVVFWCHGSWWSASWFGLRPPFLLWKMVFFLLWIKVLTSL